MIVTKKRNKQNQQTPIVVMNQSSTRRPFAGKIIKNRSKSIADSKATRQQNIQSRCFQQIRDYNNFTRPSSKQKDKDTFLERYNEIKNKYQMIDQYLENKVPKFQSLPNSRVITSKRKQCAQSNVVLQTKTLQKYNESNQKTKIHQSVKQLKVDYSMILRQLKHQINLDGKLRTLKHKLNQKNSQKVKGILIDKYNLSKEKINLSVDEFDPFMIELSEEQPNKLAQQIHTAINQCQVNWLRKVSKVFRKQDVEALFNKLDFDKQDQLTLKAFVREMSMVMNLNLRKRDLYSIFTKLKGDCFITKKSFLRVLSI